MSLKLRVEALEARATRHDPTASRLSDDMKEKIILRVFRLAEDAAHPLHRHAKALAERLLAPEFDPVAVSLAFRALSDEARRKDREARGP
jgi:hypothetical protein